MIAITNWQRFQHYKDRTPPWIKLHRSILENREWRQLDAFAAKLLVELWLLAADTLDGTIDLSTADIAWRLRYHDDDVPSIEAALRELHASGFIRWSEHDASAALAGRAQGATPETETETEESIPVSDDTGAAPGGDAPAEGPAPPSGPPPDDLIHRTIAPLVRERWWRGKDPPPDILRREPKWDMGRELDIAKRLIRAGEVTLDELCEVVEYARIVLDVPDDRPMSFLYFNRKGRRDVLNRVLDDVRRRRDRRARAARKDDPLKRIGINVA